MRLVSVFLLVSFSLISNHASAREASVKTFPDTYNFIFDAQAIAFGPSVPIPAGYYELCKKGSAICRPDAGKEATQADGAVRLTKKLAAQLVTVNKRVNAAIRPISDKAHYGVADRWNVSPKSGDCEDFALTKKAQLLSMGWPSGALLIALATTSRGEEHAVLIVRTDRGALVLDNLDPRVRGWRPELYRWQSVQSATDTWVWNKIQVGETMVASNEPLPDDIRPNVPATAKTYAALSPAEIATAVMAMAAPAWKVAKVALAGAISAFTQMPVREAGTSPARSVIGDRLVEAPAFDPHGRIATVAGDSEGA